MKKTGTGIRDVLSNKGMTQEQLADKLGMGLGIIERTLNLLPPPDKLDSSEKAFIEDVCAALDIDKTLLLFKCIEKDDVPEEKKEIFDELAPSIMGLIDNLLKDDEDDGKEYVKGQFTREELIKICEDGVVHHTKWKDRDSYSAQKGLQDVYRGLTAGLPFTTKLDVEKMDDTIWITFDQPVVLKKLEDGKHLAISSREDYFRDCDPDHETEMFDGNGIDFESEFLTTYLPTRQKLDKVGSGNDWY